MLTVLGDHIVALLYDDRYLAAGWMTQVLAAGGMFRVIGAIGPMHLARGESFIGVIAVGSRSIVMLVGMVIGGWIAGNAGLIIGIAAAGFVDYPVHVWISRRYGLWLPALDVAGLLISGAVVFAGLAWL